MQMAQVIAGYSLGEADMLRRAMGKKNRAEMDAARALLRRRAGQRHLARPRRRDLRTMEKFAGYGFNKSHAAPTR
jgi:DNA polymerase-3 subunit alpha